MRILKEFRLELLAAILLIFGYLVLRLINLSDFPIFTDEAIYARWAQIALHDSSWRFISLTDGKQPMFVWVAIPFMKLISDPLLAGRLVSVTCGLFSLLGIGMLTRELFSKRSLAFLASLLYVCFPFAQVYDRMALYDSMVGMFAVWSLFLSLRLVKNLSLGNAYTLGIVLGGGVLTKTSAFFSLLLLPLTILLERFNKKDFLRQSLRSLLYAVFSILIALGMYMVLRLSPLFGVINQKNETFVYPLREWIHHPFTYFIGNLHGLSNWLFTYLGISYTILLLLGFVVYPKYLKEKIMLGFYFLTPFLYLAFFGKVIFPRFIYFTSLYLIPIISLGLYFLLTKISFIKKSNLLRALIILIVTAYPLYTSVQFATNPVEARIADADSTQYVNGWNSGWGVREAVNFLTKEAKNKKIFVGTEGTFGMMPYSLEMYLVNNPNIVIKGYWGFSDKLPIEALTYAKTMPSYFIFYQPNHRLELSQHKYPLESVLRARQGNTNYYFELFRITPP